MSKEKAAFFSLCLCSTFVSEKKRGAPVGFLLKCTARCRYMQVDEREIHADSKNAKWVHDFFVRELPFCLIFAESIDRRHPAQSNWQMHLPSRACKPCALGAEFKKRREYPSFSAPLFRTKTMAFSPSLARPCVQCFPIFAFTSSPGGCKYLFSRVVRVKVQKVIAFTHRKMRIDAAKMAEFIDE